MMAIFIYAICFLFSWVLLHHILSQLSRRYRRLPPGPTPLPIIGNLLNLGDKPHISLANMAKIHGPVMCLKLGSLTTVVITSPSSAKEVLQTKDVIFSVRTIPDAIRLHAEKSLGWLPLDTMGKNLRKIANSEIFTSSRLDAMSHLRKEKVSHLLSHVEACCQAGVAVDIAQAVFTVALNLMSTMFFSIDLVKPLNVAGSRETTNSSGESYYAVDGKEFQEIVLQITMETGKPNLSDFFPILRWFDPQGRRRGFETNFNKMLSFVDRLIDKRMDAVIGSGCDEDVLDALLRMSQQNINGFDRPHIGHMLGDLFIGGTDTTSSTIEWAMAELLLNPTKMKKAQKELEDVIGRDNHVEEADIAKLPYLQAVFKETMRLHPTIPLLLPRKASSDAKVSGYLVPKDSQVMVNVSAIQKDPNVWEDALSFKPERFIGSNIDTKGLDFELIPFGSGRRTCPGMPLAIRFVQLTLASLIHSYDWKLEDGVTPKNLNMEEEFGITLHKAQPLKAIPLRQAW